MARKSSVYTDEDWDLGDKKAELARSIAKGGAGIPDFIKASQEEETRNMPSPVRTAEESMAPPQTDQHLKAMRRLVEGLKDRHVPRDEYGQVIVGCSCNFEQMCPICDDRMGPWVNRNEGYQNPNQNNRNENNQSNRNKNNQNTNQNNRNESNQSNRDENSQNCRNETYQNPNQNNRNANYQNPNPNNRNANYQN